MVRCRACISSSSRKVGFAAWIPHGHGLRCQKYLRTLARAVVITALNCLSASFKHGCSIASMETGQRLSHSCPLKTVNTLALPGRRPCSICCSFNLHGVVHQILKGCGLFWSLVCVPGEIAVALCHLLEYAHTSVLLVGSDAAKTVSGDKLSKTHYLTRCSCCAGDRGRVARYCNLRFLFDR